jgi:hypothetical protein
MLSQRTRRHDYFVCCLLLSISAEAEGIIIEATSVKLL